MKNLIVIVLSIFLFSAAANAQVTRFFDTWTSQESNKDLNINPTGTGKMVVNGTPAKMCPEYTSAGRNAFTTDGGCVYNINSFQYEYYDGNAATWKPFGTGSGSGGLALWSTATSYLINDFVVESDKIYRAIANHLSTIFASDLANWTEVSPVTQQLTIGTIDSQVKSADGASINANAFYLQTADDTFPGLVSTGTQTFAGDKSVSGNLNSQTLAVSGNVNFVGLSGSLPVQTDASKNLVSMAIDLSGSQTTGIVPITKGGTGSDLSGATASSLVYKNSLTTYDAIPNWVVQNEGGLSAVVSINPTNPGGPTSTNIWNFQHNIIPAQDIPDQSYIFRSDRVDIGNDYTLDDVTIGAVNAFMGGSSNVDQMTIHSSSGNIGDGTNRAHANGATAYYSNLGVSASSEVNQLKGFDLNLYTDQAALVGDVTGANLNLNLNGPTANSVTLINTGLNTTASSNINNFIALNTNPVFNAPVAGAVSGINFNPTVNATVTNGVNPYYSNPTINVPMNGMTGYFIGGNGSGPVNNYIGMQVNPVFASPGQYVTGLNVNLPLNFTSDVKGADFQITGSGPSAKGVNVNLTGTYSADGAGLTVDTSGATVTGGRTTGISATGGGNFLNTNLQLINNGNFDAGNQIVTLGSIASGVAVSTDFIGTSSPLVLQVHDNATPGALGIGTSAVGYVSQIIADAGTTLDTFSLATAGFIDGGGAGGTIDKATGFRSIGPIFTGGALALNNYYHFKAEQAGFGTNVWGVYVADSNAENYLDKSLAIGTATKKVANSDIALEIEDGKVINLPKSSSGQIAGYTALEGMFGYDDTQNFPTFYNGSSWVLMDGSGGGGGSTTVLPGALDSQAKTANGFYASGNTVAMQSADATFSGIVTTGAQTFAGDKSFTGNLNAQTLVVSGNVNLVGLSVSLPVQTDASNNLVSQAIDLSTAQAVGVNTLAKGGTNKNITASNGAFVYSDADSFELSGIGSAGQPVLSGGAGAPSYFTGTGLVTAASGNLNAAYGAANTVAGMDSAGTAIEYKAVTGTTSQVVVSHSANSIALSLPQNIAPDSNVTFASMNLGSPLAPSNGGTGLSTYATGDLIYAPSANTLAKRAAGSDGSYLQMVSGLPTWSAPPTGTTSYVRVNAVSGTPGLGSTNTTVRYFSNIAENSGTDITYASSTTNGDSFTINVSGVYNMTYTDQFSAPSYCAITKNGTQLSTDPNSLTASNTIIAFGETGANDKGQCSATVYLQAGDVIRAQASTTISNAGTYKTSFQIAREVGSSSLVANVYDEKNSKTDGGTCTSGSWVDRDLTTLDYSLGTELVTNGAFTTDLSGWTVGANNTWVAGGYLQQTYSGGGGSAAQAVAVTNGEKYLFRAKSRMTSGSGNTTIKVYDGTNSSGTLLVSRTNSTSNWVEEVVGFTAISGNVFIEFYNSGDPVTMQYDDVSLKRKIFSTPSFISLSGNTVTLAAGKYHVTGEAPALGVGAHKARLYNSTATDIVPSGIGTSASSDTSTNTVTTSNIDSIFTIGSSSNFKLQHQCTSTKATTGFGANSNLGEVERYSRLRIQKLE